MALQQNRTSDTSIALIYAKWVGHSKWDLNSKEEFFQDLKSLYALGERDGYDGAKAQAQKLMESL